MARIDPDLLDQLTNRMSGVLGAIAILVGIAAPFVRPEYVTPLTGLLYVETVLLVLAVANIGVLLVHVSEERSLHEWTRPLRQNPVNVERKVLDATLSEDDADHVEHHYEVTPAFDDDADAVDRFYALVGTDRDLTWEDLDIRADGGNIDSDSCERRDWGDMTRFIFPIRFSAISGGE
jgi:hypothetical protein